MPEPVHNLDQARQLLARILGPDKEFSLLESRHGWVSRPIAASGTKTMGTAAYVIDKKTGIVTRHPSLALPTIGDRYDEAILKGLNPPGRRIYPPQHRIQLQRIHEDPNTIEYRIRVTLLDQPTEPETVHHLQITKDPLQYQPTDSLSASAMGWIVHQLETAGTWPVQGTVEG
ncbi:hypothetical protein ACIO14_12605 [Nocardia fluminea]|uniref:hypothetical protein n=1 Tax=Nocardia fluminea TaxID=134984 RepID=UPI00381A2EBD